MIPNKTTTHPPLLELPETAPRVRVTAGLGSATQKTWNLRRPVTLIGSHRPAHIVLHERDISRAHCVIVNTGTEVLLKDLHTHAGTVCDGSRIDLTVLEDGQVITVGQTRIQVAIQVPDEDSDDSRYGVKFQDPTTFLEPVSVGLLHTEQRWTLREAVTLIGRHDSAPVWLEHEEVANRHAILFRFLAQPAVFDLCARGTVSVNGRQCSVAVLGDGDRVGVGPFSLRVSYAKAGTRKPVAWPHDGTPTAPVDRDAGPTDALSIDSGRDPIDELSELSSRLHALRGGIAESWERLNTWQAQNGDASDTSVEEDEAGSAQQDGAADARDAAVRGRLHDVARYHEQLTEREREIERQFAKLQREGRKLAADQEAAAAQDADLKKRSDEVGRREHAIAQRWTRVFAASCPHCGRQIGPTDGSTPAS